MFLICYLWKTFWKKARMELKLRKSWIRKLTNYVTLFTFKAQSIQST